jgi:hypothetical protein
MFVRTLTFAWLALAALATPKVSIPRPDPRLTPGAVFPGVTVAQVCIPGYAHSVRNIPASKKYSVYRRYGIRHHALSPGVRGPLSALSRQRLQIAAGALLRGGHGLLASVVLGGRAAQGCGRAWVRGIVWSAR